MVEFIQISKVQGHGFYSQIQLEAIGVSEEYRQSFSSAKIYNTERLQEYLAVAMFSWCFLFNLILRNELQFGISCEKF